MHRIFLALPLLALAGCASSPTLPAATAPVATTSAQAAPHSEVPSYVDCAAERGVVKPTSISLDCITGSREITDIEWSQWDEKTALGKGRLEDKEVAVTLLDPIESSNGEQVFSDLVVDGKTVAL